MSVHENIQPDPRSAELEGRLREELRRAVARKTRRWDLRRDLYAEAWVTIMSDLSRSSAAFLASLGYFFSPARPVGIATRAIDTYYHREIRYWARVDG